MASKGRKFLTLTEKLQAIELLEKGSPAYKVAEGLGVGKTQIQNLKKRKREVLEQIEQNVPLDTKRQRRPTGNEKINDLTYEWFKDAVSRRVPVTGLLLQTKALDFANRLNVDDFKASKGWLQSFQKRNNIVFGTMSGERGDVNSETVSDWMKKVPKLCEGLLFYNAVILLISHIGVQGTRLVVPPAGNCGDETTLTCQYTGSYGAGHNWLKVGSGAISPGINPEKYRAENLTNSVILIVKNTELSDAGEYKCNVNFVPSSAENLNFECKASSVTQQIGKDKKLKLTVDRLYPTPSAFTVTTTPQQITSTDTCTASTQYPGYQRCVWTSECLSAGTYSYSVTVTTVTQATPLTGSQTIVSPDAPAISNTETISGSREVVRAVEGQPVTLQCTSSNGVPQPTLTWYRGSISGSTLVKQEDTDALTHQITPARQDDRVSYICRSWYPLAAEGCRDSKTETAMLYLTLRPSQPIVTQTNTVTEREEATFQCTSSESRPAATLSWSYGGQVINRPTTPTEDSSTETFTMVSSLSRVVTKQDNNQQVDCTVTLAPFNSQTGNTNINVRFAPGNVELTGNQVIVANGNNHLDLTCTSGTSNPASSITWGLSGVPSSPVGADQNPSGDYGGKQTVSVQRLRPTRNDDGKTISCSATNTVNSGSPRTDQVNLNLNYEPQIINVAGAQAVEGQQATLTCSASSKPLSTFTWKRGTTTVATGAGTVANNGYDYVIPNVNRTHAGQYTCTASNSASSVVSGQVTLAVQFAPTSVEMTGNQVITANGANPLVLTCTSETSNPVSSITWDFAGVTNTPVRADQNPSGDYGGKETVSVQRLKPTRDDDGKTISCSASNTVNSASPQSDQVILDLNYKPLITPIADVVAVEGQTATLSCSASSKPPSTFTWKRGATTVDTGTGSTGNNKHDYMIQDVDRNQDGTYTCRASNGIEAADTKNAQLTVHYAPDISVTTSPNNIQEGLQLQIDCSAAGKPTNYNFNGFTQTWRGTTIKSYSGSSVAIPSLSLVNSGTYTCVANNGVPDRSGTVDQTGSKDVLVKVKPLVLATKPEFIGSPGESVNITIPFYSYPAHTRLEIKRQDSGRSITRDTRATVGTSPVEIPYLFFDVSVSLDGMEAVLMITNFTENDLSNYTIEIQNEVDTASWPFWISSRREPDTPASLYITVLPNKITVTWEKSFNGGLQQWFIVETAGVKSDAWRQILNVTEGDIEYYTGNDTYTATHTIQPGEYKARIFAANGIGRSTPREFASTFTVPNEIKPTLPLAAIGGGVGGGAIVILIAVFALVVIRRRRSMTKDKPADNRDGNDDFVPEITENVHYDSSDSILRSNGADRNDLYSTVNKAQAVPLEAVYSMPDKKKGKKNAKKDDKDLGDLYATPMKNKGKQYSPIDSTSNADLYATPMKKKGADKKSEAKDTGGKKNKGGGKKKDKKGKDAKAPPPGDLYENAATLPVGQAIYANSKDNLVYEDVGPGVPPQKPPKPSRTENKDGLIYLELDFKNDPNKASQNKVIGIDDMTEYGEIDFNKKADPLPDSDQEDK